MNINLLTWKTQNTISIEYECYVFVKSLTFSTTFLSESHYGYSFEWIDGPMQIFAFWKWCFIIYEYDCDIDDREILPKFSTIYATLILIVFNTFWYII